MVLTDSTEWTDSYAVLENTRDSKNGLVVYFWFEKWDRLCPPTCFRLHYHGLSSTGHTCCHVLLIGIIWDSHIMLSLSKFNEIESMSWFYSYLSILFMLISYVAMEPSDIPLDLTFVHNIIFHICYEDPWYIKSNKFVIVLLNVSSWRFLLMFTMKNKKCDPKNVYLISSGSANIIQELVTNIEIMKNR